MDPHVYPHVADRLEALVADAAPPRHLVRVQGQDVAAQRLLRLERLLTAGARERASVGVHERMPREVARPAEPHRTARTLVRLRAGVDAHVEADGRRMLEPTAADRADVRHVVGVRAFVELARAVLREALRAAGDAAGKRTRTGVRPDVTVERPHRPEDASALTADVLRRLLQLSDTVRRHTMRPSVPP